MLHLELHASLVTAYSSTVAQRVTCAADASGAVHHGRAACVRPAVLLQHGLAPLQQRLRSASVLKVPLWRPLL